MMRLYDTKLRRVVPFEPGHLVTLYSCGITPYDAAHVGHAAVYLTFDLLQRRLIDLVMRKARARAISISVGKRGGWTIWFLVMSLLNSLRVTRFLYARGHWARRLRTSSAISAGQLNSTLRLVGSVPLARF